MGRIRIQSLRGFFCTNVHFEAKPRKVVREEGDPFLYVGTGFKDKCAVIYINHVELEVNVYYRQMLIPESCRSGFLYSVHQYLMQYH